MTTRAETAHTVGCGHQHCHLGRLHFPQLGTLEGLHDATTSVRLFDCRLNRNPKDSRTHLQEAQSSAEQSQPHTTWSMERGITTLREAHLESIPTTSARLLSGH